MTCPRCGAPVPADARFCASCGLAATSYAAAPSAPGYPRGPAQQAAAPSSYSRNGYPPPGYHPPGPPGGAPVGPYPTPQRQPLRERVISVARVLQLLAALACLVHGVVSVTARRAAYVDLGAGGGGSASSDRTNTVLLTLAGLASVFAVAAALLVLIRGRGRGTASGAGLSLVGVGWLVVLVGAALVSGADTRAAADTAAAASVLVGLGFGVVALGHGLLAVGLKAPTRDGSVATAPYPGPDPYRGTPLARDPADRQALGAAPS